MFVDDRPKITRQPQDIVVLRDDPAQMTCGTEGAKKVQWFHKGRPIKGDRYDDALPDNHIQKYLLIISSF